MSRINLHDLPFRYQDQIARQIGGVDDLKMKTISKPWSQSEIEALRLYYANTPINNFSIESFANSIGRTFCAVALKASRLGFTDPRTASCGFSDKHKRSISDRMKLHAESIGGAALAKPMIDWVLSNGSAFKGKKHTEEYKAAAVLRAKEWHKTHDHPRGMLGKHHTEQTKAAISNANTGKPTPRERIEKTMRTKLAKGNLYNFRPQASWKAAWVELGGKRFYARSRWEANYAKYLEFLKTHVLISDWQHEPETFWFDGVKRGCVSYLPDFKILKKDGSVEYHEVKGWMDARSKTKIKRMGIYHPEVKLVVIDSKGYRALQKSVKQIVPGWE